MAWSIFPTGHFGHWYFHLHVILAKSWHMPANVNPAKNRMIYAIVYEQWCSCCPCFMQNHVKYCIIQPLVLAPVLLTRPLSSLQALLGWEDCVTALLSHNATVLMKDVRGCTALHLAASCGHAEILSRMLSAADHTNPHHPISDCHGFTPTHWAAHHGRVQTPLGALSEGLVLSSLSWSIICDVRKL